MDGTKELRFKLVVDPTSKRTFITAVETTVGGAVPAVAQASGKMRKSLADVFSTGALLRVAAASYAFKRLADAADEPSLRLQALGGDLDALKGKMGTELQAAAGQMLSGLRPTIQALTNMDGGARGAVLGLGALVAIGPTVVRSMKMIGLSATPTLAALTAISLLAGIAVGKAGERAAADEQRRAEERQRLQGMTNAQIQAEIDLLTGVGAAADSTMATIRDLDAATHALNTTAVSDYNLQTTAIDTNNRALRAGLDLAREVLLERGQLGPVGALAETPTDLLARLNVEIALGRKSLSQARAELTKAKADADQIVADLSTGGEAALKRLTPEQLKMLLEANGDAAKTQALQQQAVKAATADVLKVEAQIADYTQRIGQEAEKTRSETYHRKQLLAEIADLARGELPVLQLQTAEAEYQARLAAGHKATEIEMLDLQTEILTKRQQINATVDQQLQAQQDLIDGGEEEYRQQQRSLAVFTQQLAVSLSRLAGANDAQVRAARIQQLQQELGLEQLTAAAILAKARAVAAYEKQLGLEATPAQRDQLADTRAQLSELTGLLTEQQTEGQKLAAATWEPFRQGAEQAIQASSHALVKLFTEGKASAKDFAQDMVAIFEQLLEQLIAKGIAGLLLSIFAPGVALGAGGGGLLAGLLGAGGGTAGANLPGGGGGTGNLNWVPQPTSGPLGLRIDLRGVERRLDALGDRIDAALRTPLRVGQVEIAGSNLRYVLARETTAAAGRSLGKG